MQLAPAPFEARSKRITVNRQVKFACADADIARADLNDFVGCFTQHGALKNRAAMLLSVDRLDFGGDDRLACAAGLQRCAVGLVELVVLLRDGLVGDGFGVGHRAGRSYIQPWREFVIQRAEIVGQAGLCDHMIYTHIL